MKAINRNQIPVFSLLGLGISFQVWLWVGRMNNVPSLNLNLSFFVIAIVTMHESNQNGGHKGNIMKV